jgi:hypothetical protein
MITGKLVTTRMSNLGVSDNDGKETKGPAGGLNNRKCKREDIKVVRLRMYVKCHDEEVGQT